MHLHYPLELLQHQLDEARRDAAEARFARQLRSTTNGSEGRLVEKHARSRSRIRFAR